MSASAPTDPDVVTSVEDGLVRYTFPIVIEVRAVSVPAGDPVSTGTTTGADRDALASLAAALAPYA